MRRDHRENLDGTSARLCDTECPERYKPLQSADASAYALAPALHCALRRDMSGEIMAGCNREGARD
jgi:hypothetical protein